ncbi:MAG: flagellar type III secretion system pore protein FliP [Phycisphaerales bacterium]
MKLRALLRVGAMVCVALVASRANAQGSRIGPPATETVTTQPTTVPASTATPSQAQRDLIKSFSDSKGINPLEVLDSVGSQIESSFSGNSTGQQPGVTSSPKSQGKAGGLSTAINILLVLTVVSLVPSIMLMTTCFMRILIVLGLLRQALGTSSIPPPQVITALALFMTLLVMGPTLDRINNEAIQPYRAGKVKNYDELWNRAKQPVRDYMFAQIDAAGNWNSVYMVLEYRGKDISQPENLTRADVDMISLLPAYMLSELKVAFLMGFKVYLPFLVIDMVISMLLIAMGMMMLPPVLISLPFKLLLFILVDGWTLVVGGLLHSFVQPTQSAETAMLMQGAIHGVIQVDPTFFAHHANDLMNAARSSIAVVCGSRGGYVGVGGVA